MAGLMALESTGPGRGPQAPGGRPARLDCPCYPSRRPGQDHPLRGPPGAADAPGAAHARTVAEGPGGRARAPAGRGGRECVRRHRAGPGFGSV